MIEESPHVKFNEDIFPNTPTDHPASILDELVQCSSDSTTNTTRDVEILEPYIAQPELNSNTNPVDAQILNPEVTFNPETTADGSADISSASPTPTSISSSADTDSLQILNESNFRAH